MRGTAVIAVINSIGIAEEMIGPALVGDPLVWAFFDVFWLLFLLLLSIVIGYAGELIRPVLM